jgi:hypothetical protein
VEVWERSDVAIARLLGVAATLEAATGLPLMIHPPLVVRLLLGADLSGPGVALGRVAGFEAKREKSEIRSTKLETQVGKFEIRSK